MNSSLEWSIHERAFSSVPILGWWRGPFDLGHRYKIQQWWQVSNAVGSVRQFRIWHRISPEKSWCWCNSPIQLTEPRELWQPVPLCCRARRTGCKWPWISVGWTTLGMPQAFQRKCPAYIRWERSSSDMGVEARISRGTELLSIIKYIVVVLESIYYYLMNRASFYHVNHDVYDVNEIVLNDVAQTNVKLASLTYSNPKLFKNIQMDLPMQRAMVLELFYHARFVLMAENQTLQNDKVSPNFYWRFLIEVKIVLWTLFWYKYIFSLFWK